MTTSIPCSTGTFHYSRETKSWTWSEQVYSIYGFAPGDVVPTTELIASHTHPDDRAEVEQLLAEAIETGRPHSLWHRLVDADGSTREVVTIGAGEFDDTGTLVGLRGFLVDLTEAVRRTTAREVDEAMQLMSHSRPAIEQAKGALMMTYGLSAEGAFQLLRSYSQRVNVKVRDVARNLVEALADRELPVGSRATWDSLAAELDPPEAEVTEQPGA